MKLDWTETAIADLLEIDSWLTENADPLLAEEQIERIRQKARRLLHFPSRGPVIGRRQRYIGVDGTPYLLIYRITGASVEILRVHHDRQNWRP